MVREEPTDQGEEPEAKRGRFVEQEAHEQEVREDDNIFDFLESDSEFEDSSSEEEHDDDDEDNEEEKSNHSQLDDIPADAEDAIPAVDEVAMNDVYDKVVRDAINVGPTRARSNGSSRSGGTVLRYEGINRMMVNMAELWQKNDEEKNALNQTSLWPFVYAAVQQLRNSGKLNHQNQLNISPLTEEFNKDFEDAVSTFLKTNAPGEPKNATEKKARVKYENRRVKLLQRKALQFHRNNGNRPGWYHKYGILFPVQATYDMIEYLKYAMPQTGFCFDINMAENTVWHPEISELNDDGRRLMETCFIMDPSVRQEFVDVVNSLRKENGSELTKQEETTVINLFDTMNSLFNLNFEHFLMDNADLVRKKREIRKMRRVNAERFRELTAEANAAYRVLQEMMHGRAKVP